MRITGTGIFIALILLSACDNTLEVTAPWKDIPVVHGILSPNDTAHYIRIEKAFLDPAVSALEVARIPDSIYYPELDVALVSISTGDRYQMIEVDATNEGYPREDGVFATEPNILYKLPGGEINLQPGESFRLEVNRSDELPLVTAETEIVGRPQIQRPLQGSLIRFTYNQFFTVFWLGPDNAFFYDVTLFINYEEGNLDNPGVFEAKTLAWVLDRNVQFNEVEILGVDFYEYLAAELEADPRIVRRFTSIDVEVNGGGQELFEFRRVLQANTGITSVGGEIPVYTNLSEGRGIFTSAHADLNPGYDLHPESQDSLQNGSITGPLNFQ